MPRNISFSMTTPQVRARIKTVTRRVGWWNLKPGEILNACVKCMGLKRGEKVQVICQIRVVSVRRERLNAITQEDVIREGFPSMERPDFIRFFLRGHDCKHGALTEVNRIEFEYL